MTAEPTQLQERKTLKWYLNQPAYKARFEQMMGERASQFMTSILNAAGSRNFQNVEPTSILAAAAVAATLNLPIDKNLGYAWIIPYGKLAQFQIGWKGFVQLAIRSGQYAGMNAFTVNQEALAGYDNIGDPLIEWSKLDKTKPAVGYAFAWRLNTGFSKIVYWTREEVQAHAKRYSQAYKANHKDSPWFTDFDKMALKTVIMNSLRSWGILSIELREATERDQSAAIDIEAEPIFVDNEVTEDEEPAEGASKADTLAAKLAQERTIQQREPGEEDEAETSPAQQKPKPGEFTEAEKLRSALTDAYVFAVEEAGEKAAKEALYASTGKRSVAQVTDAALQDGLNALAEAARKK